MRLNLLVFATKLVMAVSGTQTLKTKLQGKVSSDVSSAFVVAGCHFLHKSFSFECITDLNLSKNFHVVFSL